MPQIHLSDLMAMTFGPVTRRCGRGQAAVIVLPLISAGFVDGANTRVPRGLFDLRAG
jgi:Na+/glutamate symporter